MKNEEKFCFQTDRQTFIFSRGSDSTNICDCSVTFATKNMMLLTSNLNLYCCCMVLVHLSSFLISIIQWKQIPGWVWPVYGKRAYLSLDLSLCM